LISVGQLDEEGHAISFHGGRWKVSMEARILARGYKTGTLYTTTNIRDTVNEAFDHRFWDDQNRKIIRSRKITFNEQYVYKDKSSAEPVGIESESKKSQFVNLDKAMTDSQKGKQVVEVELDEQRSLTDECDDEKSSRNSQHREEPYSLARSREKHDRKASERYGFEDMVSFALTASSGDPLSIQGGMLKEVELLQNGKTWGSGGLLKGKKAKWCRWVYRKKESSEKAMWPSGLVEKHGGLSKPCPMLKFKRRLDLSGTCGL